MCEKQSISNDLNESNFTPGDLSRLITFVKENGLFYDGKRIELRERKRLWLKISGELEKSGM